METLPQDLVDEIVSYLLPKDLKPREPYDKLDKPSLPLAPLATVSRRLHAAVERLTFKSLRVSSSELEKFNELLTPVRRYYLSDLTFTVILPSYDTLAAARAESPVERAVNDGSYTKAIRSLFQTLQSWEEDDPKTIPCRFSLFINHPESPSDSPWPSKYAPWGDFVSQSSGIYEGRYLHSFIDLLHPEKLPELQRVKQLVMHRPEDRYGFRNVYPKVPFMIASKMPNLERISLSMDDEEKRFPEIRTRNRDEAAHALRELSLPSLKRVAFDFFLRRYRNESASPPVLHTPGVPDPLSSAICEFSQNLKDLVELSITGAFDTSLLSPLEDISRTPWPKLRFLDFNLHATTPSGGWYFTNRFDRDLHMPYVPRPHFRVSSHSDLHNEEFSFVEEAEYAQLRPIRVFRGNVLEETLVPLIDAYADALSAMPMLTSAALNFQLEDEREEDPSWFCVAYFAPCQSAQKHPPRLLCPKCNRGVTRQLVTSLLDWEPSQELATKLRSIGDEFRKEPMVEKGMTEFLKEHEDDEA